MIGGTAGLPKELADGLFGIGGGARGFSKLPSWFCGKRGLAGGEMTPAMGEYADGLGPTFGVVGLWKLELLL